MSKIFVIDSEKRPLDPIHPTQALDLDIAQVQQSVQQTPSNQ
ncbi:MAG: hypothetical protein V7L29_33085 [Nostoc sp.]